MSPEQFVIEIWETHTRGGMTLPLPPNWRLKVAYIPATADDWEFAVRKAVEMTERQWNPVKDKGVFDYAVGIVWHRLAETSDIDSRPLKPYVVDPAAEMKATADALAAEIAEEEAREARDLAEARRVAFRRERNDVIMSRISGDLVRNTSGDYWSKIHRPGCRQGGSYAYEIQPEDTTDDLCKWCFREEMGGQPTLRIVSEESE